MVWNVDVSFSGTNTMNVDATLSRIDGTHWSYGGDPDLIPWSRMISFTTNDADSFIGGDHFGFAHFFRQYA